MKKNLILALVAALGLSQAALAAGGGWSVGGQLGYVSSKVGSANASGTFGWGFMGQYRLMPELRLGADFLYGTKNSVKTWNLVATGDYMFADAPGLYVGARLGMISTGATTSSSGFAYGGQLGYDYMVAAEWSIGGQFAYTGSSINSVTVTMLSFIAPIKYHF